MIRKHFQFGFFQSRVEIDAISLDSIFPAPNTPISTNKHRDYFHAFLRYLNLSLLKLSRFQH